MFTYSKVDETYKKDLLNESREHVHLLKSVEQCSRAKSSWIQCIDPRDDQLRLRIRTT